MSTLPVCHHLFKEKDGIVSGCPQKGCFRYRLLAGMDRLEAEMGSSSNPTHQAASVLRRNLIAGGSGPWGEEQQLEAPRRRLSGTCGLTRARSNNQRSYGSREGSSPFSSFPTTGNPTVDWKPLSGEQVLVPLCPSHRGNSTLYGCLPLG